MPTRTGPQKSQKDRKRKPTPRGRSKRSPLRERVVEERRSLYLAAVNEAAERVFAEKGVEQSRMREIAAEAGISLGTLYGVIEGKDSLRAGIQLTRLQEFLECIQEARDSREGTLERHLAVVREGAQFFLDRPDFLRMCCRDGYGWASRFPEATRGASLWDERAAIPRELFAQGIAEGIYVDEDADLLVRKMLALKQVELSHWVDSGMKQPHTDVLERMEAQFLRAFCLDPAVWKR